MVTYRAYRSDTHLAELYVQAVDENGHLEAGHVAGPVNVLTPTDERMTEALTGLGFRPADDRGWEREGPRWFHSTCDRAHAWMTVEPLP